MRTILKKVIASSNQGFSIVEMLIYMGLFAIFLTVLTSIFASSLDVRLESEGTSSVEQDGRYLFARLSHDIRRADAIVQPAGVGSASGTLILDVGGSNNTYSLSGDDLILTTPSGSDPLNGDRSIVSNLSFERVGTTAENQTIRVGFTLTSLATRASGPETRTFQTTIGLRDY